MKRIYVVIDVDNGKSLKAFADQFRADDYADDYYERKGCDTRVDTVWYNDTEED